MESVEYTFIAITPRFTLSRSGMSLNCIWWWGSSSKDLGNIEHPFIAITPSSILIGVLVPVVVQSMQSSLSYPLSLVVLLLLVHFFTLCVIWKLNRSEYKEVMLDGFILGYDTPEETKTFVVPKVKVQLLPLEQSDGWRNFFCVARTFIIRQVQISLKPWLPRLCSKILRQIWQVVLWEYQVSLASHSPQWFINFMALAEAFRAVELCFTRVIKILQNFWLSNFCKFTHQILVKIFFFLTLGTSNSFLVTVTQRILSGCGSLLTNMVHVRNLWKLLFALSCD